MKRYIIYSVITLVFALCTLLIGVYVGTYHEAKRNAAKEPFTQVVEKPVYVHDTITEWKEKTKVLHHYDTLKVAIADTLTDSAIAEIPIFTYNLDTVLNDSTHVQQTITGYNVKVDCLTVEYPKTETYVIIQQCKRRWRFGFGFAVGIGVVY